MKRWLSLLRSKNLLMVAATQSVVWCALPIDTPAFLYRFLLVLSTVAITAGGYLINDWYDVKIDQINKPKKAFLKTAAQKKGAIAAWILLSLLGLLLAIPPARNAGMPALLSLQVVPFLALWWYAAQGKRLPVTGNVLVALLTALSIELPQFYIGNPGIMGAPIDLLALFALLLTLMREIVKDLQDEPGDRAGGCKTLPVIAGRKASIRVASFVGGGVLLLALFAAVALTFLPYTGWGFVFGLLLLLAVAAPLIVWMKRIWHCHTATDYARSSRLLKRIMLAGLLIFAGIVFCFPKLVFPH